MTRRPLVLPFALIGAVIGAVGAAGSLREATSMLAVTPLVAAGIGALMRPRWTFGLLTLPVLGGALDGAAIDLLRDRGPAEVAFNPTPALEFAVMGGFVGVFVVPLLFPPYAVVDAMRGRAGSLVSESERRTLWSATLAAIAVLLAVMAAGPYGVLGRFACALGAAGLLVLDLREYRRACGLTAGALVGRTTRVARRTVDLGVGESEWEEASHAETAYRDGGAAEVAYRGDPKDAMRVLTRGAVVSAVIAALAVALCAVPDPARWSFLAIRR